MKKLYSLTTLLAFSLTLLSLFASAQYDGTYTAVKSGNWHATGVGTDLPIWLGSEPSPVCKNCHIILNDGITVTMNAAMTLSGTSLLELGTQGSELPTKLVFTFTTNVDPPSPFDGNSLYHRLNLVYTDPVTINVNNAASIIDASTTSKNDGVFLAVPTGPQNLDPYTFVQRLGTVARFTDATTMGGPATLSSGGTLPIILSDFTATLNDGAVDLAWVTQMEVNSDHFSIQRSTDAGAHWAGIATVAAHGNSSTVLNYSYTDNKPAAGTSEYRLQMVDKDGKYAYSAVKTIRTSLISAVSVYPNPARDYVNVTLGGSAQSATIRLLNQSGQLLQEKNVSNAAGTIVALSVGGYPQGNYLIVVVGPDGAQQVSKLLISK